MMRHGSRPFVVEVKRGQKRTPPGAPTIEHSDPQLTAPPTENSLDEIFRRAEAALFERAATSPEKSSTPDDPAGPASQRRILENLTEVDPLAVLLAERGEASRRGRKPGSKNRPKDISGQEGDKIAELKKTGSVELTPERVNEALKAMERATGAYATRKPSVPAIARPPHSSAPVALPEPGTVASVEISAAGPLLSATVHAHTMPTHMDVAGSTQSTTKPAEPVVAAGIRSRDRGSIRNRYVTGSEPRPGERWKRRLRGIL